MSKKIGICLPPPRKKREDILNDYDGFLEKFKPKRTTDDCFTPAPVYDAVIRFVASKVDLTGREIIRPFWPGGDYQTIEYPERCIVIDNPPFSIYSKIVRFYLEKGIDFFLFAPHLSVFVKDEDVCYIITNASITYENGAIVNTSFVTNLFSGIRIWLCPELHSAIDACAPPARIVPKNTYPDHIITSGILGKIIHRGVELIIPADECHEVGQVDALKRAGKSLFGRGFLLSERAAAERAAAERAAAERAAAERAAGIKIELSPEEWEIVRNLSRKSG